MTSEGEGVALVAMSPLLALSTAKGSMLRQACLPRLRHEISWGQTRMTHYPDDVLQIAWAISARHLVAGQKDVTLMIADAIMQERRRRVDPQPDAPPADRN